jgi:hypothetical protein
MPSNYELINDFKGEVLDSIESILAQGLQKEGRYRMQWKEDATVEYHANKAISHILQYLDVEKIDGDTNEPHLSNANARLLIALWHHFKEERSKKDLYRP